MPLPDKISTIVIHFKTTIAMSNSKPTFKTQYDNFIGVQFVPPGKGAYFDNISPIDSQVLLKRRGP